MAAPRPVGDRAFAIDAAAIGAVSAGIVVAADRLAVMSALVPAVVAIRFALWLTVPPGERTGAGRELVLVAGCTAVGAFNDWSSVVRYRVYDYEVPAYFPELSTIPLWMLLYWGLILRFLVTLFRWRRLDPAPAASDRVGGARSPVLRVAVLLAMVVVTRQLVYRFYDDPVLSWLPFAIALLLYGLLLRPDRHERRIALLFAVGGPLVEIAYIQLGGLHSYRLGWLAGVPLWIALWWVLAALIWRDLSLRIVAIGGMRRGRRRTGDTSGGSAPAPFPSHARSPRRCRRSPRAARPSAS
jgi:hypothetical protein